MFLLRFILLSTLLFATKAKGQQQSLPKNIVGKTFVSRTLQYLEILNDSTLYSSINSYTDTANLFLRNDTLFIRQRYLQTDQTGTKWMNQIYNYKVITLSEDTIQLKNNFKYSYKPPNWEDTLVFVNIEKLKEPITEFKFLTLNFSSPWIGKRKITIDSLGRVSFNDNPHIYSADYPTADKSAKPKSFTGQLTPKEFLNFKTILSKSLPSSLPYKRDCPMDGSTSNFEILIAKQNIKSTGCDLSWTHAFLLNYIYDIDHNKGLLKKKH